MRGVVPTKIRPAWTGVTLAAALTLGGCGGHSGDIAYNPKTFGAPDKPALPLSNADYRLGVGDVVTVNVFKVDSLSGDQTLDAAGRINMPLIGAIQAAGLTTGQLEKLLAEKLGERYLASPNVAVSLKTAMQKTVTVDGSVQQPGIYPVQGDTTLIQTVAMARGTADGANPHKVVIFRKINGQRTAAAFDLTEIRKDKSPDPTVYPDDLIVVDGSAISKALKSVLQTLPLFTVFRPF